MGKFANLVAVVTPDIGELMAPVGTGAITSVSDTLPQAIPVLVLLSGIGIAIGLFRKFGVKR